MVNPRTHDTLSPFLFGRLEKKLYL